MRTLIVIALSLAIVGCTFLGIGLTGQVVGPVSETCCLPPNCAPENLCTAQQVESSSNANAFDARLGLLLIVAAGVTIIAEQLSEIDSSKN